MSTQAKKPAAATIPLAEGAALLGIHPRTAQRWAHHPPSDPVLPRPFRIGGKFYFSRRAIENFLTIKSGEHPPMPTSGPVAAAAAALVQALQMEMAAR